MTMNRNNTTVNENVLIDQALCSLNATTLDKIFNEDGTVDSRAIEYVLLEAATIEKLNVYAFQAGTTVDVLLTNWKKRMK